jgi:pyruvate dehydrogenase E2 component (dihydrolipoamide acetyltransferase)
VPRTAASEPAGIRISPKARRLAKEQGVDLAHVKGSGPGGEILASDIPLSPAADLKSPSSIGRLMAERTTQSWTTVPHFFVSREAHASALIRYREKVGPAIEQSAGVRPTHSDLLVALVAHALGKHPRLNASWIDGRIQLHAEVNIGLAMAVDDGVVAAVIRNAGKISLAEIARQRKDLAERARANRLRPADISDITFTISNLGMYNVDGFTAIITPPQAAILAVGRISDRVVALNGQPAVLPMMTFTLSSDHRVVDGARAASFLNDVVETVREPENWLR